MTRPSRELIIILVISLITPLTVIYRSTDKKANLNSQPTLGDRAELACGKGYDVGDWYLGDSDSNTIWVSCISSEPIDGYYREKDVELKR